MIFENPGFSILLGKGFVIKFPNNYQVSVQFGYVNYCDNFGEGEFRTEMTQEQFSSKNAEVAVRGPDGELLDLNSIGYAEFEDIIDQVKGDVEPMEVLALMNHVANL